MHPMQMGLQDGFLLYREDFVLVGSDEDMARCATDRAKKTGRKVCQADAYAVLSTGQRPLEVLVAHMKAAGCQHLLVVRIAALHPIMLHPNPCSHK